MNVAGEFLLAWPWALALLPLPFLVWLFVPAVSSSSRRALKVPDLARFENLQSGRGSRRRPSLLVLLALLIWMLTVVALARPQWLGEPVSSAVSGRDLMLCIDISGSMRETDIIRDKPDVSRMQVVRKVGSDFISRRAGDRIGLIMFGSQAYVQTPLTLDHATVQHFLGEAEVGLAGNSTAIGDAIGLGIKRLRDRPQQSRVLILVTDGANSAGVVQPLDAAEMAAKSGIRIHTIGVGPDPRGVTSAFGRMVQRSELDEQSLAQIAETTGGTYFRARNVSELESIYNQIDQIEPVESEDENFRPLTELFPWPLGMALLLSVLGALTMLFPRRPASVVTRPGGYSPGSQA